jgi:amino acid adenylation domain-containing protein
MAAMLDQFEFLLSQIAAVPDKTIDRYSLVTPVARKMLPDPTEKLGDEWRGAMPSMVSRQAELRPEATAVVDAEESWTYEEVDRHSSRIAHALIAGGIEPGDAVAICARRCAALAPALLGVLKAGAVFVILDPAYPPARLADYFNIAMPKAWLQMERAGESGEELASVLRDRGPCWRMNLPNGKIKLAQFLERYPDSAPAISIEAESPAYIAFTSGSTGQPKGVVCRHGPMTHFLPWQEEAFGLDHADRYALLSGLAYNHLHRDLFTALASGAALFVPTTECLKEPELLVDWLGEHEITILHLTPALGRLLKTASGKTLPSVRRIFFGGDLLLGDDVRAIRALAPNAKVVSLYGATETQRAVGYWQVTDEGVPIAHAKAILPTGRGAPSVQLLLITSSGQLAGVGEIAELYVRSPHLAAGYLNDDALSTANFLVNPVTGEKQDRLYRTGDMGRYLPDGNVEWVGRIDRRVSIRGFRVELSEVESVLRRCSGVRNAAVVARKFRSDEAGASKESRLVAYVERETSAAPGVDDLRRFISAHLPHYMVPNHFHVMDHLPLNPNGKVDYSNLPARDQSAKEREVPFHAPRTVLERELADILAQVLGVERIGRQQNFFELGGHSLLAAQAAARIREALRVALNLRAFLETPTVEALARRVEAMGRSNAAAEISEFVDREEIEL